MFKSRKTLFYCQKFKSGVVLMQFVDDFPFMTITFAQKMVLLGFLSNICVTESEENVIKMNFHDKNGNLLEHIEADSSNYDAKLIEFLSKIELSHGNLAQ